MLRQGELMSTPTYTVPPRSGYLQAIWVFTLIAAVGAVVLRFVNGGTIDADDLEDSIKRAAGIEAWADLLTMCAVVGFFAALVLGGVRALLTNLFPAEVARVNEEDNVRRSDEPQPTAFASGGNPDAGKPASPAPAPASTPPASPPPASPDLPTPPADPPSPRMP